MAADYSIPGLRIRQPQPPTGWALIVESNDSLEGWIAHDDDPYRPTDLDPMILYRDGCYRIEPGEIGWRYYLNPLAEEDHRLHKIVLEASHWLRERGEQAEQRAILESAYRNSKYEWLLGWLPARSQERLSDALHFSPAEATRKMGFLELLLGCASAGIAIPLAIGGQPALPFLVPLWLCVEGMLRWTQGSFAEEALGLLILEFLGRR